MVAEKLPWERMTARQVFANCIVRMKSESDHITSPGNSASRRWQVLCAGVSELTQPVTSATSEWPAAARRTAAAY